MDKIRQIFSNNLKQLRGSQTQSAFAEKLNVSLRGYQRLESGVIPRSKQIEKISKVLGVSETSLFTEPPQPPPTVASLLQAISDQERRINSIPDDLMPIFETLSPQAWDIVRGFVKGLVEGQGQKHPEKLRQSSNYKLK